MKRFLSAILLVGFCVVQAAPMAEFSKAIGTTDVKLVQSLLQQNILTEPEALELLNEAEQNLCIDEKAYWKSWDYSVYGMEFLTGAGLAIALASDGDLFAGFLALTFEGLALYSLYAWYEKGEPKVREAWVNALIIQRLLYKASLDAQYPVKAQA